jgi:hypothetical protein
MNPHLNRINRIPREPKARHSHLKPVLLMLSLLCWQASVYQWVYAPSFPTSYYAFAFFLLLCSYHASARVYMLVNISLQCFAQDSTMPLPCLCHAFGVDLRCFIPALYPTHTRRIPDGWVELKQRWLFSGYPHFSGCCGKKWRKEVFVVKSGGRASRW